MLPAPLDPAELLAVGLGIDPWLTEPVDTSSPTAPAWPQGPWGQALATDVRGLVRFRAPGQLLMVSSSRAARRALERERAFCEGTVSRLVPLATGSGSGWFTFELTRGSAPSGPGPWLRDLRSFLHDMHTSDLDLRPRRLKSLRWLARMTDRQVVSGLQDLRHRARRLDSPLVPTHGSLRPCNLFAHANGRLVAVTGYHQAALAPVERDAAAVLLGLCNAGGHAALQQVPDVAPDPAILAAELIHQLAELAERTWHSPLRNERTATIDFLARSLLDDPFAPALLLPRR